MSTDDFYIECPNFEWDKKAVIEYQKNISKWLNGGPKRHYKDRDFNNENIIKWYDYWVDPKEEPFLTISNSLNGKHNNIKYLKNSKGGSIPYHIDPIRKIVMIFPITENNSLNWINADYSIDHTKGGAVSGEIIESITYTCPTIINTARTHGILDYGSERIALQTMLHGDWDDLVYNYPKLLLK